MASVMSLLPLASGGGGSSPGGLTVLLGAVLVLVALVFLVILLKFGLLWIQCLSTGVPVGLFQLVGMALRKVNARVIVDAMVMAWKAGVRLKTSFLESHYLARGNVPVLTRALVMAHQGKVAVGSEELGAHLLAGGDVERVVEALISASRAHIPLDFDNARAIDLAGRDIKDAVNTSVNPKVIDCPNPHAGRLTIDAVAIDGIQLKAKARVTVRTCLDRLVGGATEETIVARVGEGIVSAIGSAQTHKEVLENPDKISKAVLSKGLDANTAFEILSIDIADVDVGENIGARLQTDQAEADKRVAQAMAEKQAAMARAREQEMKARVVENRAEVVKAEAEIPKAIA